jgi:hypothetical protein
MNDQDRRTAVRHGVADATMGADHTSAVGNTYGHEYQAAYVKGQRDYETAQVINRSLGAEREAI